VGDVVSLADVRAAREPKVEPEQSGLIATVYRHAPGRVTRVGAHDPHVIVDLVEPQSGRPREALIMPAQDALDLATALIAAVKGGPSHVA